MIKRLARCIREYKWAAILSPLCMIGEVAMEVTIPLIMAQLYDYGVVLQDMRVVVVKSIQLVLFAMASLSFGVASAVFASKAPMAILDEPSSALDPIAEYMVFESMIRATEDKGVLFISHRFRHSLPAGAEGVYPPAS